MIFKVSQHSHLYTCLNLFPAADASEMHYNKGCVYGNISSVVHTHSQIIQLKCFLSKKSLCLISLTVFSICFLFESSKILWRCQGNSNHKTQNYPFKLGRYLFIRTSRGKEVSSSWKCYTGCWSLQTDLKDGFKKSKRKQCYTAPFFTTLQGISHLTPAI